MTVNQVYAFLNDALQQSIGAKAIDTEDLTGLVSTGNALLDSSADLDKFLGVLTDRIGRVVLRNLDLTVNYPNIVKNGFEFGAALEKISIQPLPTQANTAWEIGDVSYTPSQFAISKGDAFVSIFKDVDTWKVRITIPDSLFKTAFTSPAEMGAFIDGLTNSLTESMTLAINQMNKVCVNNFVGQILYDDKHVCHLLTEYNTAYPGATISTAEEAMHEASFLKFAGKRIEDHMRYMNEPNVGYNKGVNGNAAVRRTARDNMHVFMLSEFNSAYDLYLTADTFHDNMVGLPFFQPVTAWQDAWGEHETSPGSGTYVKDDQPSFKAASTIDITTSDGDSVNVDYIVCALADREALGTTMYGVKSSSVRNDEDEYTNLATKATIGYFNDFTEQGMVFVVD